MENYQPNSHKFREEQKALSEKKVAKVVRGNVKLKKKSEIGKFADIFIATDAKTVFGYLTKEVLIPNIVNLVEDMAVKGIRMFFRGDAGRSSKSSGVSYVSYRDYSSRKDTSKPDAVRTLNGYDYDDIIIDNRAEAEEVLTRMDELIETYGHVSVADLYDLVGKTCKYTDNKYGWTNVRNAEPVRVRDGYILKLPKVTPLNIK